MSAIKRDDAVFVAIDFQEKLMPAMSNAAELEQTIVKLSNGIRTLGVPVIVTQQYTKGLGPTIPSVTEAIGQFDPIDKTTFSAFGHPDFVKALEATGRKSVILCGIEAHICVQQTAEDLIDQGYKVYIVQDCISSRKDADNLCSQARMAAAGAIITTYESVLYELLGGAKAEGFKEISAIVK